jgi:putative membrane protein
MRIGERSFFVSRSRPDQTQLIMKAHVFAIALASAGLVVGCKKKEQSNQSPPANAPVVMEPGSAAPPEATPPAPQPAAALSDAQIAAIVVAANQVDIDAGQLAIKKATNPEVKKFAERMVTDHTAVNKSAVDLVTKLKVTPAESDASKSLTSGGVEQRAKLDKLEGDAFDRAYVDNEVAYHEAVIGVLKTQLIPAASNAELKSALTGAQPAFEAHLEHAKKIQQALASGGSSTHAHGK